MKKYIIKEGTNAWALSCPNPLVSNVIRVSKQIVRESALPGGFLTNKDVIYYEEDIEKDHEYIENYIVFKLPENQIAPFFAVRREEVLIEEV